MKFYNIVEIKGFSLIELMITVAIVAILSVVAIPVYHNYVDRAKFTEALLAVSPYKIAIELGIQEGKKIETLDGGSNGIPESYTDSENLIEKITVIDGEISVIVKGLSLNSLVSYVLTPEINSHRIHWKVSGSCKKHGIC